MGVQSLPILAFKTLGSISLLREVGIGYQWHQCLRWAVPNGLLLWSGEQEYPIQAKCTIMHVPAWDQGA